jgi:large subunit ribosomal protein L1
LSGYSHAANAPRSQRSGRGCCGREDLVERIQKEGGANCDILVATPDVMPLVGRLGQILKQKMPNPKAGTVSANVGQV